VPWGERGGGAGLHHGGESEGQPLALPDIPRMASALRQRVATDSARIVFYRLYLPTFGCFPKVLLKLCISLYIVELRSNIFIINLNRKKDVVSPLL
jgi:hypothetical protein